MGYYVVDRRRERRMPSPRLARAGRRLTIHYIRLQDEILVHPWAQVIVPLGTRSELRSAIRSAALRLSVASLTRDSLQRAAMWSSVPMGIMLAAAVPFLVGGPIAYTAPAVVAGAVVGVVTLLVAAAWQRALLQATLIVVLAVLGIAIELPQTAVPPAAADAFTTFCVTPAAMYAGFLPMAVIAYGYAWRLVRIIDPRARLLIGLLRCVHQMSRDARWLHDARTRDRTAAQLEHVARIAERDLPRLLSRRAQDAATKAWLRESAQLIGTRIRECKQALILPDAQSREAVPGDLLQLLLHAASSDWNSMRAQQPPPKTAGPLQRYGPRAATAIVLIVAGLVLPEILPVLKGAAGSNLRTVLLLSGFVALVPVNSDSLNRIPDTFADAVMP